MTTRERPILFSAPMVRAILAGTKTQTRRLVKPQPPEEWSPRVERYHPTVINKRTGEEEPGAEIFGASDDDCGRKAPCEPGDRLWVREMFAVFGSEDVVYRADPGSDASRWTPSIFMPREASRLTLEVTSVRVERLCAISQRDAAAEGVDARERCYGGWPGGVHSYTEYGREVLCPICGGCGYKGTGPAFRTLWDSINGKRAPWSSNPWVWVIGFKRVVPE